MDVALKGHQVTLNSGKRRGRALLTLRQQFGLTQEELARRAGVVSSYVSRFELGHYESPSMKSMTKLASAFGLPDASALERRLEQIDQSERPPNAEAERIRAMADDLVRRLMDEIKGMPEQQRSEATERALAAVKRYRRTQSGGNVTPEAAIV